MTNEVFENWPQSAPSAKVLRTSIAFFAVP